MNLLSYLVMGCCVLLNTAQASTSSSMASTSTSSLISSSSSTSVDSSTTSTSTPASTKVSLPSSIVLPKQSSFINKERPMMINSINIQRSGMKNPLLCQDSLLTSLAQQHANDMAATDLLDHNLPCTSNAFPVQFCSASTRLAPYGETAENIVALTGNSGTASSAMAQFNEDAGQFSNMMNPDFLYVGVGMAMNPVSGKYYWVQVFSSGNYQGVSCTLQPRVTVLDAYNRTRVTVQPLQGLNLKIYPQGITDGKKSGLFCTMVPYARGSGTSVLSLGQLPYPTITMIPYNSANAMKSQITGIIGAFAAALSQANATIIGPSSLKMIPMQVTSSETEIGPTVTWTSSVDPASMMDAFSPTDASQSSALVAMSSMMADPSMSSAAAQMAQFMVMATTTSSTLSSTDDNTSVTSSSSTTSSTLTSTLSSSSKASSSSKTSSSSTKS